MIAGQLLNKGINLGESALGGELKEAVNQGLLGFTAGAAKSLAGKGQSLGDRLCQEKVEVLG